MRTGVEKSLELNTMSSYFIFNQSWIERDILEDFMVSGNPDSSNTVDKEGFPRNFEDGSYIVISISVKPFFMV